MKAIAREFSSRSLSSKPADVRTAEVIINRASGTANKEKICGRLAEIFASNKLNARITIAQNGAEAAALARSAASGDSKLIVAGGGDGTISAVAAALIGTDKTLGVLPFGTFNYFARNHSIPLDLSAAARNIVENNAVKINVGEVNGRIFLNNSSIGIYPKALRAREKTYQRWGRSRLVAYFPVLYTILKANPPIRARLQIDDLRDDCATPLIFAVINDFQLKKFGAAGENARAAEKLAVYVANPLKKRQLLKLTAQMFLGKLKKSENFRFLCGKKLSIETPEEFLHVAADGEVVLMKTPLQFRLLHEALRVIVPQNHREKQTNIR